MTEQSKSLRRESFEIQRKDRNVHYLHSYFAGGGDWLKTIGLMSDLHWDNPKSDHGLIKEHLQEAKQKNAKVILNGDTFCLMQGKWDPRGSKSHVRPEHNKDNYLDAVIDTAVEFFEPFKDTIVLLGRGNHETSVLKRHETDVLQRFIDLFNYANKPQQNWELGGYGGWVRFMFDREESHDTQTKDMKYFHGSGGGGIVTKGAITVQRRQAMIEGADIIWSGHVHEDLSVVHMSEKLDHHGRIKLHSTQHIITSTYKEEYGDGFGGWHVERGASPKPIGGAWLEFYVKKGDINFRHYSMK